MCQVTGFIRWIVMTSYVLYVAKNVINNKNNFKPISYFIGFGGHREMTPKLYIRSGLYVHTMWGLPLVWFSMLTQNWVEDLHLHLEWKYRSRGGGGGESWRSTTCAGYTCFLCNFFIMRVQNITVICTEKGHIHLFFGFIYRMHLSSEVPVFLGKNIWSKSKAKIENLWNLKWSVIWH